MRRLLDKDPTKEAARQRRLLSIADRRFAKPFRSEIARAMAAMVAEYERTGDFPALPIDHERRMGEVMFDLYSSVIAAFAWRILDQGKSARLVLEVKFGWAEFIQRLTLEYIAQELIRRRIVSIAESTRRGIVDAIARGQTDGLGVDAIARGIRDRVPAISLLRANTIARTETHGAANYGAHNAAKATGLRLKKEWVSVEDAGTRDFGEGDGVVSEYNHRSMNGQVVDMDEPFLMPRLNAAPIPCQFPGDPALPVGAVVKCRCAVSYIVDDGF